MANSYSALHIVLSGITLVLAVCFLASVIVALLPVEREMSEGSSMLALLFFFLAHFFVFVVEWYRNSELLFRRPIVLLLWGGLLGGLSIGAIF